MKRLAAQRRCARFIRQHWIAGVIIVLAALPRLFQLDYGLPELYLEDEYFFVDPALRVADGTLNPGWFGAPAQPLIYALAAVFRVLTAIINQLSDTTAAPSALYQLHLPLFQTAGRALLAVCGAVIAGLAYAIGLYWSRRAGIWAGVLVATNHYLIWNSHIIRPDIIQIMVVLAAIWAWLYVMKRPDRWGGYLWFGSMMGLAINSKYPSLFLLLPVGIYLFAARRQQWPLRHKWLAALGVLVLVSFLTGPYLYLDPGAALHDIRVEARPAHTGHDGYWFPSNLQWYATHALPFEVGSLLYGLAVAVGLVLIFQAVRSQSFTARQRSGLVLVITALSYTLCLSALALHWERWVLLPATLLLIVAAIGLDWLTEHLHGRRWLLVLCIGVLLLGPAVRLARTVSGLSHPPTLATAAQWVQEQLPPADAVIAQEMLGPHLLLEYNVTQLGILSEHPTDWYQEQGITHIITNETTMGPVMRSQIPALSPDYVRHKLIAQPIYREILGSSQLVHAVYPYQRFTLDELIYDHDWNILKTLQLDIAFGPYVHIYEFKK